MVQHPTVRSVLDSAGTTFCEQAGFSLRDTPSALYQLLVLTTLIAKPISAELATAGARELRTSGIRRPEQMLQTSWQHRVDALGRAHYTRFDESSATILGEQAQVLVDDYRGDLRRLAKSAGHDCEQTTRLLTDLPGIGPAGASVFLREAQRVWPWLAPYVDDRTADGAGRLGFATEPANVRALLQRCGDPAGLAAAFVRATLDDNLAKQLRSA